MWSIQSDVDEQPASDYRSSRAHRPNATIAQRPSAPLAARSVLARRLSNSESSLTQKSQQLDAALNNMSQGLSMFDGQGRLIICNRQYNEIYKLAPAQTRPGTSIHDIVGARVAGGQVPAEFAQRLADFMRARSQ